MSVDLYSYWRSALAGKADDGLALPTIGASIPGENPQCGLWKVRPRKGEPHVLMQVWLADAETFAAAPEWRDGLTLAGQIGGKPAGHQVIVDRWLFAEPATKDEAAHWRQHGRWPSDPPPIARTHNLPSDPFAALKLEVDDRIEQVQQWLTVHSPIGDQVNCDMARNMQAELLDLTKRADKMHETEKRPHLEACRRVDDKFRFRDALKDWAGRLRVVFEQFLRAEERRLREESDRKYREEVAAAEAERARIEAVGGAVTELPPLPPPPEPVKVQAGGGRGRKAGLKSTWDAAIVDYKLAALHVIEDPDVQDAVGKVITRLVKAAKGKINIPGVQVTEVRKAA